MFTLFVFWTASILEIRRRLWAKISFCFVASFYFVLFRSLVFHSIPVSFCCALFCSCFVSFCSVLLFCFVCLFVCLLACLLVYWCAVWFKTKLVFLVGVFICLLFLVFIGHLEYLLSESWPRTLCAYHHFSTKLQTFVGATRVCNKKFDCILQIEKITAYPRISSMTVCYVSTCFQQLICYESRSFDLWSCKLEISQQF